MRTGRMRYYCSYCYYTHGDKTEYALSDCMCHINANHGARANAVPLIMELPDNQTEE